MKLLVLLCAILGFSQLVSAQDAKQPPQPGRVTSSDGRVVVFGSDSAAITAVLSQVTALRQELNLVIKDPDNKANETLFQIKNDFIITLFGKVGDPPPEQSFAISFGPVEGSPRYRIDLKIHLAKGLNRELLRKHALECLLTDRCLKETIRDGQDVQLAPWLTIGLLERLAWRNGDADRGLYKALFKSGLMMDIEEMVSLRDPQKLDAAERTAFRVTAGAFVMSMVTQDGGAETFLNYLELAPSFEGDAFLLFRNTFFAAGLSDEGLAKRWALQLANLTQEFVTETLTPLATEEALAEVLQGTVEDDFGGGRAYRLIAYQDILSLPEKERGILLSPMLEKINLLSFRCFPSYRPLLSGYARITEQLAEGDDKDVAELLMILEEKRTILRQVGERTRDYLDWYQIANATKLTGEFRDYQRLKRKLETQNPSHPGPIDRYLNAVQSLYDE